MTTISQNTVLKNIPSSSSLLTYFAVFLFLFFPTTNLFAVSGDILSVETDNVVVRSGPGAEHSIVTQLKKNEKVYEKLHRGTWIAVEVVASGKIGWVRTSLLSGGTKHLLTAEKANKKVIKKPAVIPSKKPQQKVEPPPPKQADTTPIPAKETAQTTEKEQMLNEEDTFQEKIKPLKFEASEFKIAEHSPEKTDPMKDEHFSMAGKYMDEGEYKLAVDEFRKSIQAGNKHPLLYFDLAGALFEIGELDEAISEMITAVTLAPTVTFFHSNLGKLYFKKGEFEKAEKHFHEAIRLNLGQADAYSYLAQLSFSKNDYHSAWLLIKMATALGFPEKEFTGKLLEKSKEPDTIPWKVEDDKFYLREILVDSNRMAKMLLDRIHLGEPFDLLAAGQEKTSSAFAGGYLGVFELDELRPILAESVIKLDVMGSPVIVETDSGFHILQRIAPLNSELLKK